MFFSRSSFVCDSEFIRSSAPSLLITNDRERNGDINSKKAINDSKMTINDNNKNMLLSSHNQLTRHRRFRSWTTNQLPNRSPNVKNNNNNRSPQQNHSNGKHYRRSTIHNFMASPRLPTLPEHNDSNIYSIDCLRHFEPFNSETDILNYTVPLDELDPDDLYSTFRSRVPLKRLFSDENQCWLYYDSGLPIKFTNKQNNSTAKVEAQSINQTTIDNNNTDSLVRQIDVHVNEHQSGNKMTMTDNNSEFTPKATDVIRQEFKLTKAYDNHKNDQKFEAQQKPNDEEPTNGNQEKRKELSEGSENNSFKKENLLPLDPPVLIFLPGATETADVFYKQILELSKSYRCISVFWPDYWSIANFNFGFRTFLESLNIKRAHLFGSNLGGFLAQKFASSLHGRNRVLSIILYSTWIDTNVFRRSGAASFFWMMPKLALITTVLPTNNYQDLHNQQSTVSIKNRNSNHRTATMSRQVMNSTASRDELRAMSFMSDRLKGMSQSELASRLTLNYTSDYVNPTHMPSNIFLTIIELFDRYDLNNTVHLGLHKLYPNAKVALLKSGGDYPYLVRAADVNIHITTHMNHFYRED